MLRTRGAAAWAPYPPWSITASTRYCGLGLGPKATNQLLGSSCPGLVAVPVLPARCHEAGKPSKSRYPVPAGLEMTPSSPSRMGVVMLDGRLTCPVATGAMVLTTLPVVGLTISAATSGA